MGISVLNIFEINKQIYNKVIYILAISLSVTNVSNVTVVLRSARGALSPRAHHTSTFAEGCVAFVL